MRETIKYLWEEANKKINKEVSDDIWNVSIGTSGDVYLWSNKNNVTCYIYISKKGGYRRPTFSLVTEEYPYGTMEIGYREALQFAR